MAYQPQAGDEPIPGYRLVAFLGKGGFGEVWKANAPGGIPVALKIIALNSQQGSKELRALQKVKLLSHPNLNKIQAFWLRDESGALIDQAEGLAALEAARRSYDRTMYLAHASETASRDLIIAMALADGSLADALEKRGQPGLPIDELLGYMEGAARGIDYLNSEDEDHSPIQHCDIKPQNILLHKRTPEICDFGLVRATNDLSKTGTALSYAYAASECFNGQPSSRTDQYSLAITYFQLRTGRLPFDENSSAAQLMHIHVEGRHDFSAVSLAEQKVLRKATSPAPAKRFDSCSAMVHALREAGSRRETGVLSGLLARLRGGAAVAKPRPIPSRPAQGTKSTITNQLDNTRIHPGDTGSDDDDREEARRDKTPSGREDRRVSAGRSQLRPKRWPVIVAAAGIVLSAVLLGAIYVYYDGESPDPRPPAELPQLVEKGRYAEAMGILGRFTGTPAEREIWERLIVDRWLSDLNLQLKVLNAETDANSASERAGHVASLVGSIQEYEAVVPAESKAGVDGISDFKRRLIIAQSDYAERERKTAQQAADAHDACQKLSGIHAQLHSLLKLKPVDIELQVKHDDLLLELAGYATRANRWGDFEAERAELDLLKFAKSSDKTLQHMLLVCAARQKQNDLDAIEQLKELDRDGVGELLQEPSRAWLRPLWGETLKWLQGVPAVQVQQEKKQLLERFYRPGEEFNAVLESAIQSCLEGKVAEGRKALGQARELAGEAGADAQEQIALGQDILALTDPKSEDKLVVAAISGAAERVKKEQRLAALGQALIGRARIDQDRQSKGSGQVTAAAVHKRRSALFTLLHQVAVKSSDDQAFLSVYESFLIPLVTQGLADSSLEDFVELTVPTSDLEQVLQRQGKPLSPLYAMYGSECKIESQWKNLNSTDRDDIKARVTRAIGDSEKPAEQLYGRYLLARCAQLDEPPRVKEWEQALDALVTAAQDAPALITGFHSQQRRAQLANLFASRVAAYRQRETASFLTMMQTPFPAVQKVEMAGVKKVFAYAPAAISLGKEDADLECAYFLSAVRMVKSDARAQAIRDRWKEKVPDHGLKPVNELPVLFDKATQFNEWQSATRLAELFAKDEGATEQDALKFSQLVIQPGIEKTKDARVKARLWSCKADLMHSWQYATWDAKADLNKGAKATNLALAAAAYTHALELDPTAQELPLWHAKRGMARFEQYESDSGDPHAEKLLTQAAEDAAAAKDIPDGKALQGLLAYKSGLRHADPRQFQERLVLLDKCRESLKQVIAVVPEQSTPAQRLQRAQLLMYLAGADISAANYRWSTSKNLTDAEMAQFEELLREAADYAQQAAQEKLYRNREQAYSGMGNAQEDLAWICGLDEYWALAKTSFENAVQEKPDFLQAKVNLGRLYFKQYRPRDYESPQGSVEELARALSTLQAVCNDPRCPAEGFYWLGRSLQEKREIDKQGTAEEIADAFRKAVEEGARKGSWYARDIYLPSWRSACGTLVQDKTRTVAQMQLDFDNLLTFFGERKEDAEKRHRSTKLYDGLAKSTRFYKADIWIDAPGLPEGERFKHKLESLDAMLQRHTAEPADAFLFIQRASLRVTLADTKSSPYFDQAAADVTKAIELAKAVTNKDDLYYAYWALFHARHKYRYLTALPIDWTASDVNGSKLNWRWAIRQAAGVVDASCSKDVMDAVPALYYRWVEALVNELNILHKVAEKKALDQEKIQGSWKILLAEAKEIYPKLGQVAPPGWDATKQQFKTRSQWKTDVVEALPAELKAQFSEFANQVDNSGS